MKRIDNLDWDAAAYFHRLLDINRLAVSHNFVFGLVSGLQGLEDWLHLLLDANNFFAVSDGSDGFMTLANPNDHIVKTVFMAMRHAENDMPSRKKCLNIMKTIFRQMMSVVRHDRSLHDHGVFVADRISFSEIESYFFSGCACSFFQIAVDVHVPLCICSDDWTIKPL